MMYPKKVATIQTTLLGISSLSLLFLFFLLADLCYSQIVTTLAGGTAGSTDAVGTSAQFYYPYGIVVDSIGNVYVSDYNNHKIRKITPSGSVSTFAGSIRGFNDAVGTNAQFNYPTGVAIDTNGNVYVADQWNHKIRKISSDGSVVTTFAGSTAGSNDAIVGTNAQFYYPQGVAVDSSGNVYVADFSNNRIRKITPTGSVSTFAGSNRGSNDAVGTNAQFYGPWGVLIDSYGNIYVSDTYNHKIRKITPVGSVSTLAGSATWGSAEGAGTNARFDYPSGIVIDSNGNVYVSDTGNQKIRKITPTGSVSTLAGGDTAGSIDAVGTNAQFNYPTGIAVDSNGNMYVTDADNSKIRKITLIPSDCPEGTFLSSGQCSNCPAGTFSNVTNSPSCIACPAGTFSASPGSTNCTICPQGSFCPSDGLIGAIDCAINTYCPISGLTQPVDCPLNSTNANTGSASIDDCLCDAGFYKSGSVCAGCPVGSYCPQNSSSAILCPVGYYCPTDLMDSPTICPQGYCCLLTGLTVALQCEETNIESSYTRSENQEPTHVTTTINIESSYTAETSLVTTTITSDIVGMFTRAPIC